MASRPRARRGQPYTPRVSQFDLASTLRDLATRNPGRSEADIRVVILTAFSERDRIVVALEGGAIG